ncbi:MAG: FAD-dependent oxidoreductase, partial [Gammaproteobacteria bacterium]|nr:FAD-dependent oxidoreductase [Gammaproteobacteria bacterium]
MSRLKVALALILILVLLVFFGFGGAEYLTFSAIKSAQQTLLGIVMDAPVLSFFGFALIYIVVTALSLPGAAVLTLLAGGLFGLWQGLMLVSFAASIGATLAMLAARFLFRDLIASKFSEAMAMVNQGMKADGARYLLTLRLVPAVPFFVINLVMGLTHLSAWRFYWVSQLGMLPGTLIFVNAGKQLSDLQSPAGILSPELLVSLVLLALLPWLMKAVMRRVELWRRYRVFKKPKVFDRDLIVIGAGSGGLVAALIGSLVEAKVTLIEAGEMGGDCLNTGCVPSKAFIRSASIAAGIRHSADLGVSAGDPEIDFPVIMNRVQAVIDSIKPNDSPERYREFGVDVRLGKGVLHSPYEVEVNGERLTARSIIVASGAAPVMPRIDGLDPSRCYTSETIWQLKVLPKRLAIIGGGPIGLELAQSFARLGSLVTVVEMMPRIMMKEDVEVGDLMAGVLTTEGVRLLVNNRLASASSGEALTLRVAQVNGSELVTDIECDAVLFAAGRKPRV